MWISIVLAALKAIPALKAWFDDLVAAYTSWALANMKKENIDAIRKAFMEQDQRDLEKAIGVVHPGAPSGIPGTELRDTLPGVRDPSTNPSGDLAK